jgi:3'5'-cyclic nucleotide phosphodiesterase
MVGKFDKTDPEQRRLMAYMLLKCADISNVTKPFPVAKTWGMRLTVCLCYYVIVLLCYCAIMLLWYYAMMVLWYYGIMLLWLLLFIIY